MKIAEVPDETAAGAVMASEGLGQMLVGRSLDPARMAKLTSLEQRGELTSRLRPDIAVNPIASRVLAAQAAQAQAEAEAQAQANLTPQGSDSFDWTSPWVLGGAALAVAALGGIWWYKRRQQ